MSEYQILCDLSIYSKLPRFSNYLGFIIGSILLGFASDRGGRKMIILACIWTTGIMSLFQLVGHDFISYVFFQFFIGLFIGVSKNNILILFKLLIFKFTGSTSFIFASYSRNVSDKFSNILRCLFPRSGVYI